MRRFLRISFVVAIGLVVSLSTSALPLHAQQTPDLPQIQHVKLNVELAKQAIDATLFIRKKYKTRAFTNADPADMINAMRNKGVYHKMAVELRQFGFTNPESWSKAAVSTALAVGFTKEPGNQDVMAQIMQMQRDNGMSEEMKMQMLATVKAMTPPKANINVAKLILADHSYANKIKRLFNN